jgi:hypothetical protein
VVGVSREEAAEGRPHGQMQSLSIEVFMLYRVTFLRTAVNCLHMVAHPDKGAKNPQVLVAEHEDPTVFATALRRAGVSTAIESELGVAAGRAWDKPKIDVCCEAADLMSGQLETLGFRPFGDK